MGSASALELDTSSMAFQEAIPTLLSSAGDKVNSSSSHMKNSIPFYWHEFFADRLQRVPSEAEEILAEFRRGPYILDIDLDFFVGSEDRPGRPPWSRSGPECSSKVCKHWTDPDCPLWKELAPMFESGLWDHTCSAAVEAWNHLTSQEKEKVKDFAGLHLHERLLLVDHLRSPQQKRAPTVFHAHLAALEALLARLKDHPPVIVTIARSIDGFASIRDIPEFEVETLAMLQRLWGHLGLLQANPSSGGRGHNWNTTKGLPCAEYAQGTASTSVMQQLPWARGSAPLCPGLPDHTHGSDHLGFARPGRSQSCEIPTWQDEVP